MKNKILIFLCVCALAIIVSACEMPKQPQACVEDKECGQTYCGQNNVKIANSCVDGFCQEEKTNCVEEGKLCLQDSSGVRCVFEPEDKPKMSCSDNTRNIRVLPTNPFNWRLFDCSDDCPQGYTCNTDTCLCEGAPFSCEKPFFAHNWDTDGQAIINAFFDVKSWDDIHTFTDQEFEELGSYVAIPAFNYYVDRDVRAANYYMPFPEEQWDLFPADEKGYPCANEYYAGAKGLDIEGRWIDQTQIGCGWGGPTAFGGIMVVCTEDLIEWFDEYRIF